MTSPEPVPLPPGPCAAIVTTVGMTWLATGVTAHALTAALPEVALVPGELAVLVVQPLTAPPAASAAPSASHGSHPLPCAVPNFQAVCGTMAPLGRVGVGRPCL